MEKRSVYKPKSAKRGYTLNEKNSLEPYKKGKGRQSERENKGFRKALKGE